MNLEQEYSLEQVMDRLDAQRTYIESLEHEIGDLKEELAETKQDLEEAQRERDELRAYLNDVDSRTDMLRFVDHAEEPSAEQMRIAILQHMWRAVKDENPGDRYYSMDASKTNEALHYPDVDRTTVLRWMRTTPRIVGDDGVCWYDGGDAGPSGEPARVFLDLRGNGASLPEKVTGRSVNPNNRR